MSDLNAVANALVAMDEKQLRKLTQDALAQGVSAKKILDEGLMRGMDIVGERMESGEMFIPEVLMSAKAMSAVLEDLKPLLGEQDVGAAGTVVIGTVKGDVHDIGKNLVIMMLESAGFKVHDLGANVPAERFVEAVRDKKAQLVGLSALLTTTMGEMKNVVNALSEHGLRDQVKIMVGGAPMNQNFADRIGADGYGPDAGAAVRLAKALMS